MEVGIRYTHPGGNGGSAHGGEEQGPIRQQAKAISAGSITKNHAVATRTERDGRSAGALDPGFDREVLDLQRRRMAQHHRIRGPIEIDRKSTRLNSSHVEI